MMIMIHVFIRAEAGVLFFKDLCFGFVQDNRGWEVEVGWCWVCRHCKFGRQIAGLLQFFWWWVAWRQRAFLPLGKVCVPFGSFKGRKNTTSPLKREHEVQGRCDQCAQCCWKRTFLGLWKVSFHRKPLWARREDFTNHLSDLSIWIASAELMCSTGILYGFLEFWCSFPRQRCCKCPALRAKVGHFWDAKKAASFNNGLCKSYTFLRNVAAQDLSCATSRYRGLSFFQRLRLRLVNIFVCGRTALVWRPFLWYILRGMYGLTWVSLCVWLESPSSRRFKAV